MFVKSANLLARNEAVIAVNFLELAKVTKAFMQKG